MKNVLIIGGSSDIGISLSKYFIKNKYNVIIGYNEHKPDLDGVYLYKCDVREVSDIENLFLDVINKFGKIDILINMFCISLDNNFLNKTKDEFMKVLEVNVVGTFLCCQTYSKYINDGIIINIGSTDGVDTYSEYSIDYSCSKSAINNITKSISISCDNKIICINPNWIDSDSTMRMDKNYLESELKRINQSRLISIDELIYGIDKIINSEFKSGDLFRIDIKEDKLWIEKML